MKYLIQTAKWFFILVSPLTAAIAVLVAVVSALLDLPGKLTALSGLLTSASSHIAAFPAGPYIALANRVFPLSEIAGWTGVFLTVLAGCITFRIFRIVIGR